MVRFRSIKEGEGVASEKDERGSITTNDIVPGHVSTWQATGTSAQFEFRDKIIIRNQIQVFFSEKSRSFFLLH